MLETCKSHPLKISISEGPLPAHLEGVLRLKPRSGEARQETSDEEAVLEVELRIEQLVHLLSEDSMWYPELLLSRSDKS